MTLEPNCFIFRSFDEPPESGWTDWKQRYGGRHGTRYDVRFGNGNNAFPYIVRKVSVTRVYPIDRLDRYHELLQERGRIRAYIDAGLLTQLGSGYRIPERSA